MNLITGYNGFLGDYLCVRLGLVPVDVNNLPNGAKAKYFFHFGSPSSQILFNEDSSHIKDTITDFIKVAEYCRKKHIKLVFPSSGTLYANYNSYSHTKMATEEIAKAYGVDYFAPRIFAGYGVGEEHKGKYGSIVYQWVKQMMRDEQPVIFGDGEQTRDFVYVDDIVENIVDNLEIQGSIDIGTGLNTPFNEVVRIINKKLGKNIKPIYVKKPGVYIEETVCQNPLKKFISLEEGIERIICHLKS